MRSCFYLLLFALFCSCSDRQPNHGISIANQIITDIKTEYVNDNRTAHFVAESIEHEDQIVIKGETTIKEAKEDLIARLAQSETSFIDSLELLPSPLLKGKNFAVVNLSVCNIRSKPKHSAELATQALLGTPLRVWKWENEFYFVQTPDDYFGWVDDGGIALMTEKELENWNKAERAVVLRDFEFLLEKPGTNAAKISDLTAGGILQMLNNQGEYSELAFPDGRSGFLKSEYLMPYSEWLKSRQPNADNILASAREFLGRPYLWGGTSGKGVDCSGFTKTVYFLNGLQLERDASLQVHTGMLVETDTATWENLEAGDLLFFGRHATQERGERISHVAIYMGDGKIIHASDRVKIESLLRGDPTFVESRVKTFIRAKRMIGSAGKNGVVALNDSPWY